MNSLASRLVPKTVEKLIPYQSARRIGGSGHLWLNANELEKSCQYGAGDGEYHRYPDFLPHDLANAYLEYCRGTGDALRCEAVAVRGADEAIDLMIRTFCQPGADKIMICPPTYAMYEFCAESIAVEAVKAPLLEDFQLDMPAITRQLADTKILFLCSPNNPTGNVVEQADIIALLEAGKETTLIVVDEAYIEFAPETSVVNLIEQYPNLVVIRTLSKAFGLAAIRCGFLLADSSVMEYISRLIAPYPIADPVAEIALRALESDGIQKMRTQSDELISTREWFAEEVQKLAIVDTVYVSATNFVLIRFNDEECMYNYLLSKGIVTRNQAHEPALANCVRISIGSKSSMLETLNALKEYN
ncbi:histidinol-phosphate transaminase [Photobacterium proteolyticum]|uniref:Histidinol-phosphate aminotransferase n=1 Tax=Photobacterium proteolyticum TaxID=1903952 RepID=A0A1Q9G9Z7_9GAMM|nr:histidinol-phosphate transaminase [Photobacterium proteolyticum]OLQ71161.1 histidinol-phosphate transaminase [Photobacterium proteolyticum]